MLEKELLKDYAKTRNHDELLFFNPKYGENGYIKIM